MSTPDLTAEVATIRTIVERLEHELLGNGQPGRVKIAEDKISDLQNWRAYVRGAFAVVYVALGAALTLGSVALAKALK